MEESMKRFSKSMGGFCNHLESSCNALKQSLDRRPIPLDSASSTFIQSLNRRVSAAASELNLLETMSFGTVSFEELLGHCNEIHKKNQADLLQLQDHLSGSGYVPVFENEIDEDENQESGLSTPHFKDPEQLDEGLDPPSCYSHSIIKSLEEDSLLDESLSLKNLGLSDVCLASLASEGHGKVNEPDIILQELTKNSLGANDATSKTWEIADEVHSEPQMGKVPVHVITVSKQDYESLPSYMKCLASWEELLGAVDKINPILGKKEKTKGFYYFRQDEIPTIGLGNKEKAYMLLLMRMNRFIVETVDGVLSYRVVIEHI